ncbi:unnamed protein product [Amaranthus hypochondriacus]
MFAGKKLLVSMARYQKGGTPFSFNTKYGGSYVGGTNLTYYSTNPPVHRVEITYSVFPLGKKQWDISKSVEKTNPTLSSLKAPENTEISVPNELSIGKSVTSSPEPKTNDSPNLLTTQVPVNLTPTNILSQPMVVEKGVMIDTTMTATDIQSTVKSVNNVCVMEVSTLENDSQHTDGDGLRDASNKLEVGQTIGSAHPLKDQLSLGPKTT